MKSTVGNECRISAGECDTGESCDGVADDCPVDVNAPDGIACSDGACKGGVCMNVAGAGGHSGSAGAGGASGGNGGSDIGGTGGKPGTGGDGTGGNDEPPKGGGCACRTVNEPAPASSTAFSMLGLAFLLTRRRTHQRWDTSA